jgi:membrane protease YdiL (CAAX protease family)
VPEPPDANDDLQTPLDRSDFLNLAGLCEGGLVVIAFAVGWFVHVNPVQQLYFDWWSVLVGVLATLPMLILFAVLYWTDLPPFRRIRELLSEMLSPLLAQCRWFDIVLLAFMAGLCEELLFRGTLQIWASAHWGLPSAIVVVSIVFGLVHFVTPTYFILATAVAAYLSGTMFLVDRPNLLIPITTHALYDYVGFLILIAEYRKSQRQSPLPLNQ